MPHPAGNRNHGRISLTGELALLVVGKDLQLDGKVHLPHVDAIGDGEHRRREIQDAGDSTCDQSVTNTLRCERWGGDDTDRDALRAEHVLQFAERQDLPGPDSLTAAGRVAVEQRHDSETTRGESAVVGKRMPEITDPDDDHRPVVSHSDLSGDLVAEILHVVSDSPSAVGAEIGQVFTQLGTVDPGRGGQVLTGAGIDALVRQRDERAEVDRETGDRRLRNTSNLRRCTARDRARIVLVRGAR